MDKTYKCQLLVKIGPISESVIRVVTPKSSKAYFIFTCFTEQDDIRLHSHHIIPLMAKYTELGGTGHKLVELDIDLDTLKVFSHLADTANRINKSIKGTTFVPPVYEA